jgi:cytochrome c nitrite reductase small subunit
MDSRRPSSTPLAGGRSGGRLRKWARLLNPRLSLFGIVFAVCLGLLAGVGTFTFGYAEGLSYFSADSASCANCHIMNDQYASWSRGPHHAAAGCVDCHLPHDLVPKYIAKAENGYHHSKAFTLQDFHEPIMIKPKNARILQESCVRCHGDFVHEIVPGSKTGENAVQCVHCHRGVGHGPRAWGR